MERTFVTWGSGSTVYLGLRGGQGGCPLSMAQSGELYVTAVQGVAAVENLFRKCSEKPDPYVEMARDWAATRRLDLSDTDLNMLAVTLRRLVDDAFERAAIVANDPDARWVGPLPSSDLEQAAKRIRAMKVNP